MLFPEQANAVTAVWRSISAGEDWPEDAIVGMLDAPQTAYSDDVANQWCQVDVGEFRRMLPNRYALRHGHDDGSYRLRNWRLEGRNEQSDEWTTLRAHGDDDSIPDRGHGVGCWPVEGQAGLGFRYLRILSTGLNSRYATRGTHQVAYNNNYLMCCGLEFWGTLIDTSRYG